MKMRKTNITRAAVAAAVVLLAVAAAPGALAQNQTRDQLKNGTGDQTPDRLRDQDRLRDTIYGSQLMTQQERAAYQARMRTLKTEREHEAYRLEHHKKMQERAKAQGVTLPEAPPNPRPGMGPGPGASTGTSTGSDPGAGNKK